MSGTETTIAVYWRDGTGGVLQSLNPAADSYATALNTQGRIVGNGTTAAGDIHAVLWKNAASAPLDLNTAVDAVIAAKITLTSAVGINDKCQIAAVGIDKTSGVWQSYVLTPNRTMRCD